MGPNGAEWCRMVPNGAELYRMVPNGTAWCRMVPNDAKTFKWHSLYIQVTFIIHSGDIQELPNTFLNIQVTLTVHLGYNHDRIRRHPGTFRNIYKHSGDIQEMFRLPSRLIHIR